MQFLPSFPSATSSRDFQMLPLTLAVAFFSPRFVGRSRSMKRNRAETRGADRGWVRRVTRIGALRGRGGLVAEFTRWKCSASHERKDWSTTEGCKGRVRLNGFAGERGDEKPALLERRNRRKDEMDRTGEATFQGVATKKKARLHRSSPRVYRTTKP